MALPDVCSRRRMDRRRVLDVSDDDSSDEDSSDDSFVFHNPLNAPLVPDLVEERYVQARVPESDACRGSEYSPASSLFHLNLDT